MQPFWITFYIIFFRPLAGYPWRIRMGSLPQVLLSGCMMTLILNNEMLLQNKSWEGWEIVQGNLGQRRPSKQRGKVKRQPTFTNDQQYWSFKIMITLARINVIKIIIIGFQGCSMNYLCIGFRIIISLVKINMIGFLGSSSPTTTGVTLTQITSSVK